MKHRLRQRGTVLVTVILMVAVAAVIATDIAYRQKMDILRTSAFMARDSAFQYLLSAENLGLYALKQDQDEDKRQQGANPELQDDWSEGWNKHVAVPIPNGSGTIEGQLYDLQGRFNLNDLQGSDPRKQSFYQGVLVKLLSKIQTDHPEAFADDITPQMLSQRLTDWMDTDQEPTPLDGREDDDYLKLKRPYRTANHVMIDLSELLLIEGFTPRAVELLEEYVCFLPPDTPLNLYTADQELLTLFGLDANGRLSEFAERQRPKQVGQNVSTTYASAAEVLTFLGVGSAAGGDGTATEVTENAGSEPQVDPETGLPVTAATTANADMFTLHSQYFLLKGKAVVNGKPVLIESVIWRPEVKAAGADPSPRAKKMKVILRKLVDPLKQV